MKLRAAIIVDQLRVAKWQLDSLNEASDHLEIIYVLNCVNNRRKKKVDRKFFLLCIELFLTEKLSN